jgi:probable selenium-dependent hydroxylase accessory protein YqeC
VTTLSDCLDLSKGSVAAVVGCGGKTALIKAVAKELTANSVLISTTSKIFPPEKNWCSLCLTLAACKKHKPHSGIQCMGILNAQTGKLEALPENVLAKIVPAYDVVLLEADGSKGLDCKGWLASEPVVPPYCTHTIGVVTIKPVAKIASETIVHRLNTFLALTELQAGEKITMQALQNMVCKDEGMFKHSAGKKYLVLNQIEDDDARKMARTFFAGIKKQTHNFFYKLIYGSAHLNKWSVA